MAEKNVKQIKISPMFIKKLLFSIKRKELGITFFSGQGAGGQHRNRHKNCVRLNHKDSGTMVTGQSYRDKQSNIKQALDNLVKSAKFKIWHARKVKEVIDGETLEEKVEEMMDFNNLKIEQLDEHEKWEDYK